MLLEKQRPDADELDAEEDGLMCAETKTDSTLSSSLSSPSSSSSLSPSSASSSSSSSSSQRPPTLSTTVLKFAIGAGAFFGQFVASGILYSYGVLLLEFKEEYKCGNAHVAWVGSIEAFLCKFSGLLIEPVLRQCGFRWLSIGGSLIAGLGFVLSGFATNIYMLYLTYGVIVGLGSAGLYYASVVVVPTCFRKNRHIATGIMASGSPVGITFFGFFTELMISRYNLKVALMGLSGFAFVSSLCALSYPSRKNSGVLNGEEKEDKTEKENGDNSEGPCCDSQDSTETQALSPNDEKTYGTGKLASPTLCYETEHLSKSAGDTLPEKSEEDGNGDDNDHDDDDDDDDDGCGDRETEAFPAAGTTAIEGSSSDGEFLPSCETESQSHLLGEWEQKDKRKVDVTEQSSKENDICSSSSSSSNNNAEDKEAKAKKTVDFSLWKDPAFVAINLGLFCLYSASLIIFDFAPMKALDYQVNPGLMVGIIGVTNFSFRIVSSLVAARGRTCSLLVTSGSLFVLGLTSTLMVFYRSYYLQLMYAFVCGCNLGMSTALHYSVISLVMGYDVVGRATGQSFAFGSIAYLVAPPFAGWMIETIGMNNAFVVTGVIAFLGGFAYSSVVFIRYLEEKRGYTQVLL